MEHAGTSRGVGRQAAGLRQERVGDEGAEQSAKAHKEVEDLQGEEEVGSCSSFRPAHLAALPGGPAGFQREAP